jgi:hypothetical protein
MNGGIPGKASGVMEHGVAQVKVGRAITKLLKCTLQEISAGLWHGIDQNRGPKGRCRTITIAGRQGKNLAEVQAVGKTNGGAVKKQGLPLDQTKTCRDRDRIGKKKLKIRTLKPVERLAFVGETGTNHGIALKREASIGRA